MKTYIAILTFLIFAATCNKTQQTKDLKVHDAMLPQLDPNLDCGASVRYKNTLYDGNFMLTFNTKVVYYRSVFDVSSDTLSENVERILNERFTSQGIFFDVTKTEVARLYDFSIENFQADAKYYEEDGYITIILYDDIDYKYSGIAKEIPSTVIGVQKDILNVKETLTHEMGHALGLKHIFELDHTNGYNIHYGDQICDTPSLNIMDYRTSNCKYNSNYKYTEEELKIIIPNYLNYSFDSSDCRRYFTPQQSLAMRWHIENFPSLYNTLQ